MCPIVSGNWNNATNAGVWALNLNNTRSNSNNNIGFRADSASLEPHSTKHVQSGAKGYAFPPVVLAKSEWLRPSGRVTESWAR